jgi:hypothetical protein
MAETAHRWRFFRAGGFDQVRLESAADLRALAAGELDPKLWVALSCPVRGLEFDEKTLAMLDADGDGRIRVPEVRTALGWACSVLRDPSDLTRGAASVKLSAIDETRDEGKRVLASARQVLKDLGRADATEITLEDVADTAKIFAQTRFNGDGVVPVESAEDEATKGALGAIIECLGSAPDRSGKPGVTTELLERFFKEAEAYRAWHLEAESDATSLLPLGDGTARAADAIRAVRAKVDDYFTRCRLAAFDPRSLVGVQRPESELTAAAAAELSASSPELARLPIVRPEASRSLPLRGPINPAWIAAVSALRDEAVAPILGPRDELGADEWDDLKARLASHEAWLARKPAGAVEKLGIARIRELCDSAAKATIADLIARDKALEPEANAIASVEKLVRLHRDLFALLMNFVNFRDFYTRRTAAIFRAGTLYLDGRSFDLCVRVEDAGKHAGLATLSRTYLAYCDCTRRGPGAAAPEKMTIVAAITGGDGDYLMVGRNGVFYDRKGQDWDATVSKLVEHPISVRQAFWSPYKRIAKMIGEQIEKMAASRDKAAQEQAAGTIGDAAKAVDKPATAPPGAPPAAPAGAKPPAAPFDIAKFAGIFAAIGLALGAIGTAIAAAATGFARLPVWQMPLVIAGILLLVSGPSMVIAWLKLRGRTLGPILDANGWAVNARAKINIPFGGALTSLAMLPPGSERALRDPYAEKKSGRKLLVFLLLVAAAAGVLWYTGHLGRWWTQLRSAVTAPAPPPPPAKK